MVVKRWLARLPALFGALAVICAGLVGLSSPASAALPTCNYQSQYWHPVYSNYYYFRPTTDWNNNDTNCRLAYGNQAFGVKALQDSLRSCYNQNIAVDGIFGTQTRQAVINVQNFHHLTSDGVFGPATSNAMVWPKYNYSGGGLVGCWF